MNLTIDGSLISNKETLYKELKEQINSCEFYGNNLDALYEVLSYTDTDLKIIIKNEKELEEHLGDYCKSLLDLFEELVEKKRNITIEFK